MLSSTIAVPCGKHFKSHMEGGLNGKKITLSMWNGCDGSGKFVPAKQRGESVS